MPTYQVVHKSGSPAAGIKVAVSFVGGALKEGRTDRNGYVSLSGSNTTGKVFVDGKERYSGNLSSTIEFVI